MLDKTDAKQAAAQEGPEAKEDTIEKVVGQQNVDEAEESKSDSVETSQMIESSKSTVPQEAHAPVTTVSADEH